MNKCVGSRVEASSAVQMRTACFCDVGQRRSAAAYRRRFWIAHHSQLDCFALDMGQIGCSETSVTNY
jgi:hypothetical protein